MESKGYNEKYKSGVLACLKRNYKWMSEKSDEELNEWLKPVLSYKWADEFNYEKYPYKHGMVLVNDRNVVGYLGLIYSNQYIDNEWKVVVNPTTWAIDEEYRLETFRYIYEIQKTADIVIDYTARKSLVEIFIKMFHYKNIDQKGCFFLPKPTLRKTNIKVRRIERPEQIEKDYIKKIFENHIEYEIKCMEVSLKNKKEYVFYKIQKRASIIKNLIPLDAINVLYTSDCVFLGKYYKEIIWKMQRNERAALKTDSRFFNIDVKKLKSSRVYDINRLMYSGKEFNETMSSMYTELSILLNE